VRVRRSDSATDLPRAVCFSRLLAVIVTLNYPLNNADYLPIATVSRDLNNLPCARPSFGRYCEEATGFRNYLRDWVSAINALNYFFDTPGPIGILRLSGWAGWARSNKPHQTHDIRV